MKLLFHGTGAYAEGQNFGPASWPHQDLLVAKMGNLIFQTSKGSLRLQEGDAVWIPPKLEFKGLVEAGRGMLWVVHFQERRDLAHSFTDTFEAGVGVFRRASDSELAQNLMDRIHAMYLGDALWPPTAEIYFEALLAEMKRNTHFHGEIDAQWTQSIEKWARKHLGSGIGVKELAVEEGISESHFRKRFLERNGTTAGKFLHSLRLSEAKILLQQSTLSLKEISARIGYSDAVAFHRAFSTHCHMTPTAYRKQKALVV